jgi:hypothetical protein
MYLHEVVRGDPAARPEIGGDKVATKPVLVLHRIQSTSQVAPEWQAHGCLVAGSSMATRAWE